VSHLRPPHQVRHGVRLSGRARLGPRRSPARNRRLGPRLAGMIRPAAVRSLRGKTLRPTETRKYQLKIAPSSATDLPRPAPNAIQIRLHAAQPSVV
jgi:hypothetical protein